MPKTSKKELLDLFKDNKVRLLIDKFASEELGTLNPKFDPVKGFSYPLIDEIVGDPSKTEKFLQKMSEGGVLGRKLYDKIIYCPSCNSTNVSIHYACPYCKSFDIKKSALIEHIKCGYIDIEDRFQKGNKLVCPRCDIELTTNLDYHKAGVWCNCSQCSKSFDIPVPTHFCRVCQANFNFDGGIFIDVHSYSLTSEAKKQANSGSTIITPIIELFEELGFEVESPGFLNGKSGTRQMFDLIAISSRKRKKTTAIDITTSTDDFVSEQSVISMFAKVFDANPDEAYLIVIPKMSETGRNLAKHYKIDLVEAIDQNSVIESLKVFLVK
jgi:transcription elongation factor Elf1